MINSHLLSADDQMMLTLPLSYWADKRTGHEPVGVGSSNLSTSLHTLKNGLFPTSGPLRIRGHNLGKVKVFVTRDFKSLASGALKGYEGSNPTLTAKRSPLQGDAYRSNWLKANWSTPGFHPGNRGSKPLGDTKASYQQNAVEKAIYPRINGYALGKLSTHKHLRFGLKARINTYAFTHKHLRLCGSKLEYPWPGGHSPVYTSITNNPILRTKPLFGCAKMRMN